jgi:hypothetical protein
MSSCKRCSSTRILSISGKCSDCFGMLWYDENNKPKEYDGYVPDWTKIGGGDYIEFKYCMECGQIQGEFPITPEVEDEEEE